jgi:hypothetical protein
MAQLGTDVDGAMTWAVEQNETLKKQFPRFLANELPSFGKTIDTMVSAYIDVVAICSRATECWSYESGRYFGSVGVNQEIRLVPLLPKIAGGPVLGAEVEILDVDRLLHGEYVLQSSTT